MGLWCSLQKEVPLSRQARLMVMREDRIPLPLWACVHAAPVRNIFIKTDIIQHDHDPPSAFWQEHTRSVIISSSDPITYWQCHLQLII